MLLSLTCRSQTFFTEMATPTITNNNEIVGSEANKRRRKKSIVWEHFTVETVSAGCTRACCKQCKKSFAYITGSKLAGTSHLKRHITLGICPVSRRNQEKNQASQYMPPAKIGGSDSGTDPPRKRYRATTAGLANLPFDQDHCSHEIAKMIVQHDYPLHIVEQPGFVDFVRSLQPQFNMGTLNTIQGDCVSLYLREKQSLLNLLSGIPGRVCLTLDMRTSNQTLGYVFLTGYFIDGDWKLHRRVLNVVMVPFPDSDDAFTNAVLACLSDWSLESKLFTLTLNKFSSNETVISNLRGLLSIKNPLVLNGQLIIRNCYARVISHLAQDLLLKLKETVEKVRDSVKYVKTSETREEKFMEIKKQLQVPTSKFLSIDDITKWNTTYHMLSAACELKEVFCCLDSSDPDYKQTPSMTEWKHIEILCIYLKLLFDGTNILTAATHPTANAFFHEVWKIQLELTHAAMSQDHFISELIKPLQERFSEYWKDSSIILAVAVVMDPRFKMKLVEFSFAKIYGEDVDTWVKIIDEGTHELFLEYVAQAITLPETFIQERNECIPKMEAGETLLSSGDGLSDFDVYISEIANSQQMKSELDQYLEESLLPRVQDFDILGWWKLNKLKYPTLSKMACDVLSIPISTVSADAVFDTESKKIDSYWGSLRPVTLEAFVCAKDWLQYASPEFSNAIVKMEF